MSRTDKDVPDHVWKARAKDRIASHYGCEHDNRSASWRQAWTVTIIESTEIMWHAVQIPVGATPATWEDDEFQDCFGYQNTRTKWRYGSVTKTERIVTFVPRECTFDEKDRTRRYPAASAIAAGGSAVGMPVPTFDEKDRPRRGRTCGWYSPSYRYKRGPNKDSRRIFHKSVRTKINIDAKRYAADWNSRGDSDVDIPASNLRYPWWD